MTALPPSPVHPGPTPPQRRAAKTAWATLAALWLAGCAMQPAATVPAAAPMQPEGATASIAKPGWATHTRAVAAAHPLAAQAGDEMLRAGGSAIDAAIAVQMVLTLVEPQSSGIGGGAFLMTWDGRQVQAWDGRETAPAAADDRLFLGPDGKPLGFHAAAVGGRSVGAPGVLRMLAQAHAQHGRLAWARLYEPAIRLADAGFPVGARLHGLLGQEQHLRLDAAAARHFYQPDGKPLPVGTTLRNPALAAVFRQLARDGAEAFYGGPIAASIVAKVQRHPTNPGRLTERDLADYRPQLREALCSEWQRWRLCGFPPPSSGHLALAQVLGVVDAAGPARPTAAANDARLPSGEADADFLHRYGEAARLAFADRARYVGDPAFVPAPGSGQGWSSLLDPGYLRQRASLIGDRAMAKVEPGVPPGGALAWARQPEQIERGTSHLAIVDAQGLAVSMTTTIEDQFGARLLVDGGTGLPGGFLLNNQLTDFSFQPADASGRPIANRVEPGKRPRSSMSPTLVFERGSGRLVLVAGSPGGAMIIHYTAKTLLAHLGWGLDVQQAANLPNFGSTGGPIQLEEKRFAPATVEALKARGHEVREPALTSGIHALQRRDDGWFGAADPRREGAVVGD
jgi:gamma-glutamyltranspeptidase/glutathione hydrolase